MGFDLGIIIAIVGVGIAMIGAVMAMMFWVRTEANELRADAKEDRKDLLQISRNLELTLSAIQAEMKDFHYRLLEIEKSRKT